MGKTSINRAAGTLSAGIPCILEQTSESRMEYIDAMIKVHDEIDKKIKEELRTRGANVLIDALAKAIEEELKK